MPQQLVLAYSDRMQASPARRPLPSSRPDDLEPVDISVCLASWNCRELLRGCLESLTQQSQGVRLELIVVDNGSTDGAAQLVVREFPDVHLICNSSNVGFSRANNQAARLARGRYLLFLNNDTVVPSGALCRLLAYAEARPDVGLLGPQLRDAQGQTQISYRRRPSVSMLLHRTSLFRSTGWFRKAYRQYRRQDFSVGLCRPVEVLMGAAMLIPRDVFFDCGGWDEGYVFGVEDDDLSVRIGHRWTVVYHPGVNLTHFGRMSTRQHIGYATCQMTIGFVRYLRKTGCHPVLLLAYKLVVTLDIPTQLMSKGSQYLWRAARGRRQAADKSLLAFRGVLHFLRLGLASFWRA